MVVECSLERENSLLLGQKRVLEMVATSTPLAETLHELTRFIEAQDEGLRCGVLLLSADGTHFGRGIGYSLPETCHRKLEGAPIAPPYLAPCVEAAHLNSPVLVPDLKSDSRYAPEWRDLVLSCGLGACRSTPVRASDGRVMASFEFYYDRPRDPNPTDPHVSEVAVQLARIAIERNRAEEALRESEAQRAAELAVTRQLQEISRLLIENGDIDAVHHRLVETAIAVMHADAASMQMYDTGRNALRLLASSGFQPEAAARWDWVDRSFATPCGAALAAGERVVVPDVETCGFMAGTGDLEVFLRSGLHACQSTPLVSRDGCLLGMISTHWRQPRQPSERDLHLIDLLARQAADLIERTQSQARFRQIVEGANEYAIITLAPNGSITSWNSGAERLLGYAEPEVLGLSGEVFFSPEDRAAGKPDEEMREAREKGRAENRRWHMRKDGTLFWGSGVMVPLEGKSSGFLKIFQDRTEEWQAEERQKLLLEELNHRIKNTLATVQSIAAQTLRINRVDAWVRQNFEERLVALAKGHDLLTQRSWEGAELHQIVRSALSPFRIVGEDRLHAEGPPVHLPPKATLALMLALHELATNATKYGALSNDSGRISIVWAVQGGEGNRLLFRWQESAGPPVEPPRRKGFGARLIERNLASELGGSVRLDYAPDGVICTIDAPIPHE